MHDWTLLHIAADAGLSNICAFLLSYCSELAVDCRSTGGLTALHLAARKGSVSTVQVMCLADADVDAQDNDGWTALHYASSSNHPEVIRYLTRHGACSTLTNHRGQTPSDLISDKNCLKRLRDGPKSLYSRGFINDSVHRNARFDTIQRFVLKIQKPVFTTEMTELTYKDFLPVKLIGKGGFGEVYLVKKRDSGQFYALKSMRKSHLSKSGLLKYALNERNVLLSCQNHPFLSQLHFAFQTPKRLLLVTEYYPGGDMRDKLDIEGKVSEEVVRVYAAEIVLALDYLHSREIVYRDVKPENIVLDGDGHIRVVDFGLAKENSGGTASFCGTLNYLAPEMVRREKHGVELDWYMVGGVVYEMLVGRPPYSARQAKDLVKLITAGNLTFPVTVSDTAQHFIQSLMHPDPQHRLGAQGTLQIKTHAFFNGIDWENVEEKREAVPKPRVKLNRPTVMVMPVKVYGDVKKAGVSIAGWAYTRPAN